MLKNGKAKAIRLSTFEAICEALKCQPGDILKQTIGSISGCGRLTERPFSDATPGHSRLKTRPGHRARASGESINGLGTSAPATVTMARMQIPVQTALGASPYFEQVGAANPPRVHWTIRARNADLGSEEFFRCL